MQTETWLTPTALILASGLLVLAGVFSDARPALAQAQEACPLPAGVTPPEDPRVTSKSWKRSTGMCSPVSFGKTRRSSRQRASGGYFH